MTASKILKMLYKKLSEKTPSNKAKYRSITPGIMEKSNYLRVIFVDLEVSKRENEKKTTKKLEVNNMSGSTDEELSHFSDKISVLWIKLVSLSQITGG